MSDVLLCKDCKWFEPSLETGATCTHAKAQRTDYVLGGSWQMSCDGMRNGACGPEGKLWEAA